jgi:uncharacterized protein (DUF433 family)
MTITCRLNLKRQRGSWPSPKQRAFLRKPVDWKDHVTSDPAILRGKPHLKGTRIPVSLVLGYLAAGSSSDQIVAEFPELTHEQVAARLDYARDLAEFAVEA